MPAKRAPDTELDVPAELVDALAESAAAKKAFEAMSASHRREYTEWVASAKKPETRAARAGKALAMILAKSPAKR